jgi:DNA invertase Pin-like site-specific DNA recombinase
MALVSLAERRQSRAERRAVGIVRVSYVGDRKDKGDSFVSPTEQRQQIERVRQREDWPLVEVLEELDVSGGTPLAKRRGLRRALELVETGQADIILVAYFDRLWRDLVVQLEVVPRVERVGGMVYAADVGEISMRTASRWLSSVMLGAVSQYHRLITGEKVAAARVDALGRGVVPYAHIVPGYRRGSNGVLEVEPTEARHVAEAFRMRAQGASLAAVREYLRRNGIRRSYRGTQTMLRSHLVLGEIAFGELLNTEAHPAIVDRATWLRVQDVRLPRGRHPKSDRLLARLGILRCGTCGRAMTAATVSNRGTPYPIYRCGMPGECRQGAAISATLIEAAVAAKVREVLEYKTRSATLQADITDAEAELGRREELLDAAVHAFDGLNVASAKLRLREMESGVVEARERVERLRAAGTPAEWVNAARDWDRLHLDERRALIRATVVPFAVFPGRGPGRFTLKTFGE